MGNSTVEMEKFTIGSSESCDVRITHPSVNRVHAKIYFTVDTVLIEDLDSGSGTYVHHESVYKRIKSAKIRFDTIVRIGDSMAGIKVEELIADYKLVKEKNKKDIFKRVKSVGFKRCHDCGSVVEKNIIHCDCCGAVFEETA
jgi:pSer/pThr/pTyr-binding forkhead associated (FHA) protein